jgi:hypothetical protein
LSDAIDAYRTEYERKLDKQALDLLSRLAESTDASKVFKRLRPKSRRAEADLLAACIEADILVRKFPQSVQKQKDALSRSKRWHKSLTELQRFVSEIAKEKESLRLGLAQFDLWSLSVFEPPLESEALKNALDLFAHTIEWRCGIAQANLAHLGATRDAHVKKAAENAAIWVLAAGVYDAAREPPLPGRPHLREVADLAEVILEAAISLDRVREVHRKRRDLYMKMIGDQTKRHVSNKTSPI